MHNKIYLLIKCVFKLILFFCLMFIDNILLHINVTIKFI